MTDNSFTDSLNTDSSVYGTKCTLSTLALDRLSLATTQTTDYYGKFQIDNLCYETDPCQHNVTINGKKNLMDAEEICELFIEHGIPISKHFEYAKPKHQIQEFDIPSDDDDYGKFKVNSMCYQSYPCKHHVTIDGKTSLMSARQIYKLFIYHDVPVNEHFKYVREINEEDFIIKKQSTSKLTYLFNYIKNKFI